MAYSVPSGTNTFVPSFDASGQLVVSFSRNPKDFPLNKYITLTPVKKGSGYFMRITAEQAARVLNDNLNEFVWHDANDAPTGSWALESFSFFPFNTTRYAFSFRIGYKAVEQADWKVLATHAAIAAQDAMTARTVKVVSAMLTSGNYDASHVDTATNWGGGLLSSGTATSPVIKKAFNKMAIQISKDTLGKVKPKDLQIVMSPVVADALGRTQEVHTYLKESPYALAQVRGDVQSQNGLWGLPDQLYGFNIVVEDAVRVTSRKGATRVADYVMDGNKLAMVSRPGALVSDYNGGPSFSTVHVFSYEEMTVESKDDPDNRRHNGRVVEDYDVQIVAPAAACLCTAVLS